MLSTHLDDSSYKSLYSLWSCVDGNCPQTSLCAGYIFLLLLWQIFSPMTAWWWAQKLEWFVVIVCLQGMFKHARLAPLAPIRDRLLNPPSTAYILPYSWELLRMLLHLLDSRQKTKKQTTCLISSLDKQGDLYAKFKIVSFNIFKIFKTYIYSRYLSLILSILRFKELDGNWRQKQEAKPGTIQNMISGILFNTFMNRVLKMYL